MFSEMCPGSISDSNITEKCDVLNQVEEKHEIISDKRYAIQYFYSIKGIYLNHSLHKTSPQFSEAEVINKFNVAAMHIYVERFIGRVRDWNILTNV